MMLTPRYQTAQEYCKGYRDNNIIYRLKFKRIRMQRNI